MDKILIPLAEGLEEIEAITCIDVLRRAGIKVITATLTAELQVKGSHKIVIGADVCLPEITADQLAGIVLPGGMPGANNLKNNQQLIKLIQQVNQKQGLLAAICAAPIVLEEAGILKNRMATSYPGFEREMASCIYRQERVVVDDNLITGRGPGVAIEFALEIVQYLLDEEQVTDLKKQMLIK